MHARDIEGWTPLHWAAIEGYVQIVRVLVNVGGDVLTAGVDGFTPLHRAAMRGHAEITRN